ncbi:helix-turn-helix domain-containing protein [Candidatus Kaiserbacteria bacterium]|nr:helix-turn-helix domain-containing protein [Candidatus Kaiserbacteria bacterium]USN89175.1 MAG: helix-turn-helix domain-containing protein [Candidatus Nomurabacteria bacterium]
MVRNEAMMEQVRGLRSRGFTLAEIAKYCGVSKSTVSKWLKNNALSGEVTKQNKRRAGQENAKRLKLINKARGSERALRLAEQLRTAETEYKHYKQNALFMAAIAIYMASGDLSEGGTIRLSTKRSEVHAIFIRFAEEYLGVTKTKVRFWLLLHETHDEERCMKHWKKKTRLTYQQFKKNQVLKSGVSQKPLHYGVGNTIIGSTVLKQKLSHWIKLSVKDLSALK